jgi:hypothetical protein
MGPSAPFRLWAGVGMRARSAGLELASRKGNRGGFLRAPATRYRERHADIVMLRCALSLLTRLGQLQDG